MYALKNILHPWLRFILTVTGIALCVILMLFLLSIYRGVSIGSVSYVRDSGADLWVMQQHTNNILRSSSLLPASYLKIIEKTEGVSSVAPIFFVLSSTITPKGTATVYLTGYDIQKDIGGPPAIYKGKPVSNDHEIVLDCSFAAKYSIHVGDSFLIKEDTLLVSGLSSGTNMFVIQYAFVSLRKAHLIVGYPAFVSCFGIKLKPGVNPGVIKNKLLEEFNDIAVFDQETFLKNNQHEMESGILPLLYMQAIIGAIVLTAILSLILSMHVLERRNEYAIMKALGAPVGYLPALIVKQALVFTFFGTVAAVSLFIPLLTLVERISPEVSGNTSIIHVITVVAGTGFICLVSSIIPISKLKGIYPLEVFK